MDIKKKNRVIYCSELYHHGILGQKWGIRRYQNPDGSLTPAGREHILNSNPDKLRNELHQDVKNQRKKLNSWMNRGKTSPIGEHSRLSEKEFNEGFRKKENEYYKSDLVKNWDKDSQGESLADLFKGKPSLSSYDKMAADYGMINIGKQLSKQAIENLTKKNSGYLRDLGYNDEAVKLINEQLKKSRNVEIT